MAIVRFDPLRDFATIHDRMNRFLGGFYARPDEDVMGRGHWVPPVDIYENGDRELVIKVELPDMKREDIEITVENATLVLRGEKKVDASVKEESFRRIERAYGAFSRSFSLPPTVDTTNVSADYKNGVLTVTLPQREEAKPKQIEVKVA